MKVYRERVSWLKGPLNRNRQKCISEYWIEMSRLQRECPLQHVGMLVPVNEFSYASHMLTEWNSGS